MKKKTRLREKPTRMPDVNAAKNEMAITTYLAEVQGLNSEAAKSQRFTLLLNSLFGVQPGFIEEYLDGIEKYLKVKEKDRILRGRADQLSGNLIIEFEKDLTPEAKIKEAEEQLRRYTACAWSTEPPGNRTRFACLAVDGRRFRAYTPAVKNEKEEAVDPDSVTLNLLEDIDVAKLDWHEFYSFLDRYLLRKSILPPTSKHIVKDFGPKSHAFKVTEGALLARWEEVQDHGDYAVLYEAWEKYLRIVYGSSLADVELFVRHTYLATLAKLMVWSRLDDSSQPPADRDIVAILEGSYFRDRLGIENFLEEDFFSWIARPETEEMAIRTARMLIGLLRNYNLREMSEDVLKSLYEGLVDPATRHDLGEYYTPDWLADRMVRKLLKKKPEASVLDPACGSGTFLYMAIREKRRALGDYVKTMKHIQSAVVGIDIHPLACIVAKANYVLALGTLMEKRKRKISIPVYLANSIRPPEKEVEKGLWRQVDCYKTEIEGREVHIPESLIRESEKYDEAIEASREFAALSSGKKTDSKAFEKFLKRSHGDLFEDDREVQVLYTVAEALKEMIEEGRDTIWVFVLKNIYKPLFLRDRFDIIIGNPPWLSYRYVERSDYQRFLKEQITKVYRLVEGRAELVTHLELGTLFLVKSADLYLKDKGRIGFVLPKSIFSGDQHDALRRGQAAQENFSITELWDLEAVSPLFNVSSSVLFGENRKSKGKDAVPGEIVSGVLSVRNAALGTADESLTYRKAQFNLSIMGSRSFFSTTPGIDVEESPYKRMFFQGATIVPRCFWFVDLKTSELGYNENLPPFISSERAQSNAKKAYKGCVIEGPVESKFVYATLLPADMVPFGVLRYLPIVLPGRKRGGELHLRTADQARKEGFVHLAEWLEKVENEWKKRRGAKAQNETAVGWLDYRRKLTQQNPDARCQILYAMSGTHVCACVVKRNSITKAGAGGLVPEGFLADCKTYYLDADSEAISHYLASVLNAPVVDEIIKPAQSRGLWGPRDICKKVLDLPIPVFNDKIKDHLQLAEIGKSCSKNVQRWIASGGQGDVKSIGVLRRKVREMLKDELVEVDGIVRHLLHMEK